MLRPTGDYICSGKHSLLNRIPSYLFAVLATIFQFISLRVLVAGVFQGTASVAHNAVVGIQVAALQNGGAGAAVVGGGNRNAIALQPVVGVAIGWAGAHGKAGGAVGANQCIGCAGGVAKGGAYQYVYAVYHGTAGLGIGTAKYIGGRLRRCYL